MLIKNSLTRPRVITTIHIDETTSLEQVCRAADLVLELTEDLRPADQDNEAMRIMLVEEWRKEVFKLTEPMEIRVGDECAEPVVVIHPRTREAGMAAKALAIAEGRWRTSALVPRATTKPI